MSQDSLIGALTEAIRLWDRLNAVPGVKPSVQAAVFLIGTSGAFWLVSRLCGWAALKIHDSLHEDFADMFASTYNVVLASLFGGVMALAVFQKGAGGGFLPAYQAAGFIFVYLVLTAAYANASGDVDPHSGGGYAGGIAAYLLVCLFPHWLSRHPVLVRAHEGVRWIMASPAGRLAVYLSIAQGVVHGLRVVRGWFFWKSVKIGKRRFFFKTAHWRPA